jgi:hypothetical protein
LPINLTRYLPRHRFDGVVRVKHFGHIALKASMLINTTLSDVGMDGTSASRITETPAQDEPVEM